MPLELRLHEDFTTGLVATCDVCGQQVEGANGNLLWHAPRDERPGDYHSYFISCKGDCDRCLDRRHGRLSSQGLDTALVYLLNNARVDLASARRRTQLLGML